MALSLEEFNQFVDLHGAAMYAMAYRMVGDRHEAEDLVQEAFRSAWKSRRRYEPQRGDRAWLASILRRRIVDHWRRRPRREVCAGAEPPECEVAGHDPTALGYTDEMQAALARLPGQLREALLLVVVAELTHQEVADMLNVPLGTVLSRVSRARKQLREHLLAAKVTTG